MVNWNEIKHFKEDEFRCKCGCKQANMEYKFVKKLDAMREALGFPILITSGYRCPEYNNKVSFTGHDGPHTTGRAADVAVFGVKAFAVVTRASELGFTGIGVKQTGAFPVRFIHLDDLTGSGRPWVWGY